MEFSRRGEEINGMSIPENNNEIILLNDWFLIFLNHRTMQIVLHENLSITVSDLFSCHLYMSLYNCELLNGSNHLFHQHLAQCPEHSRHSKCLKGACLGSKKSNLDNWVLSIILLI